jgi:vesicular inhibitory amino acid transporter
MHLLSYFSLLGNLAVYALIAVVVATGLMTPSPLEHPKPTSLVLWQTSPLSIGLVMMGFGGHAVFPNIYCDMQDPKMYHSMLRVTYALTLMGYCTMAAVGSLMFGNGTQKEITLNFGSSMLASVALVLVSVIPFCKFALTLAPVALGLEETFESLRVGQGKSRARLFLFCSWLLRTALVGLVLLVALNVPKFDRVVSFAGAFLSFNVSVLFPVACHLRLYWDQLRWYHRAWDILLVIFSGSCIVGGTAATLLMPDPL